MSLKSAAWSSRVYIGVAFIVGAAFLLFLFEQKSVEPLTQEAQSWAALIDSLGPEKAYEKFQESVAPLDSGAQHARAHAFGHGLYARLGDAGFPICGKMYEYGCTHGVISGALKHENIRSAVRRFTKECKKVGYPQMCMHGIGHGLVSEIGYDQESFFKAVAICRDDVQDISTPGCVGGAVMEYGLKSMAPEGTPMREMTSGDEYEPCLSIGKDAKSACYFWLPGWWYNALTIQRNMVPYNAIVLTGEMCRNLKETEYTAQCFGGIGVMAAMGAEYSGQKSVALCNAASVEDMERLYCKAYAANILLDDARSQSGAATLCASVPASLQERCKTLTYRGVSMFDSR